MIAPDHFAAYSQTAAPTAASQPTNGKKPKRQRAVSVKGKKKRSADSKSLNAPYIKLTPIMSDDDRDADMDVAVEVAPTHIKKSNDLQDDVLVCHATTMTDGH
jgi:hypothetical protein